jgi:leucyl-tRNA---protein transferase
MTERLRPALSLPLEPTELTVYDGVFRCPYLPARTARLPLRLPSRPLRPAELSQRLSVGDRRQGYFLYRPSCPECRACEAIRIDVGEFRLGKTLRRILRRGDVAIETSIGAPGVNAERVALYNRHKSERGLLVGDGIIGASDYREFLVETCAESFELSYRIDGRLLGVAIADRASDGLSAVYCYFDPTDARLSPGTYSILKMIEICQRWRLRYLYLGLYVKGCKPMEYKARFLPHERLIGGTWRRFARDEGRGARDEGREMSFARPARA